MAFDKSQPHLVQNGYYLPIKILSSAQDDISISQTLKTGVSKLVSDDDNYQFVGVGERRYKIDIYLSSISEYDELVEFFRSGSSFVLTGTNIVSEDQLLNIVGDIDMRYKYSNWGEATLTFTTAKNINEDEATLNSLKDFIKSNQSVKESFLPKKDFLTRLNDFGKGAFDFTSNTNQKIGSVTNTIASYSNAISNAVGGVASTSSLITNPINSINSSASEIIGALNSAVTDISVAINAVRTFPDKIDSFLDSLSSLGDKVASLFDLGNPNDTNRYVSDVLQEVAQTIIDTPALDPNSESVSVYDPGNNPDQIEGTNATELYLDTITKTSKDPIDVMILCSILINLYEVVNKVATWNRRDLDALMLKTESIYTYVTSKSITEPLRNSIDIVRNEFFRVFKIIYDRSLTTYTYKVTQPTFLETIVYEVNGNLDYYDETKRLNNIVGTIAYKDVEVIRNV